MADGSLLRIGELGRAELADILETAAGFTKSHAEAIPGPVVFVAERESLRTRVATYQAAVALGSYAIDLAWSRQYADPARRPDHAVFARAELESLAALGCVCAIVRVKDHRVLELWRSFGCLPVINGCSDQAHPLQALSDAVTLRSAFGHLSGIRMAFVGNGASPVYRSLVALGLMTGMTVVLVGPSAYGPPTNLDAEGRPQDFLHADSLESGLQGATVVYADEIAYRTPTPAEEADFLPFRLTRHVLDEYSPDAHFMHCLPHGPEVDQCLLRGDNSLVRQQVRSRIAVTATVVARAWSATRVDM